MPFVLSAHMAATESNNYGNTRAKSEDTCKDRKTDHHSNGLGRGFSGACMCALREGESVCECVCVCVREREREKVTQYSAEFIIHVQAYTCTHAVLQLHDIVLLYMVQTQHTHLLQFVGIGQ